MSENTNDTFKALNADALKAILGRTTAAKEARDAAKEANKGSGGGNYIPTGYLQEGKSKIRIFLDPAAQLYRSVTVFTNSETKRKVMDPRHYVTGVAPDGTEIPRDVIEKCWNMTKGLGWQDKSRYTCLCYVQVLETDNPHEKFWTPGKVYLLAANGKFEDSLLSQLGALMEGCADEMANSFNPLKDGWAWTIQVVKGTQGSVTLTPTVGIKSPALSELPDGYKPLADVYVKEGYDEASMIEIFDQLQLIRDEKGLDADGNGGESGPAENNGPVPPEGKGEEKSQDPASSGAKTYGLTEQQIAAATAMGKSVVEFAAQVMNNEEAKADLAAASASNNAEKEPEKEADGEHNNWGLTPEQVAAATAASIPLEQFAKMMK